MKGEDLGADGDWAPLPTRLQCYCDLASLVRRKFTTEPHVSIGVLKVYCKSTYGPVEEFTGSYSSVTVSGFSLSMYVSISSKCSGFSASISYIACGHFA